MAHTSGIASPGRRERSDRSQLVVFALFGVLVTIGVLFFSVLMYGQITGQEFSPDDFTRREFVYYELPLFGIQVFPIDRKDCSNELERYLTTEKLIATRQSAGKSTKRWDLVTAGRASGSDEPRRVFSEGQARILCAYLDAEDSNQKYVWLEWTRKHQDLAQVVWPIVARLARQELYFFVPDVLVAARGASDASALRTTLHQLLAKNYLELARTQQELGRHEAAVELFTEAIAVAPRLAPAFAGRAKSLTVLGEQDRASADLAQADKFGARR